MKLKKLFAGLISLAAALLAVCAITVCAGAETSGDYEYSVLDGGTVKINYYSGSATDLSIPATIGGKKVTSIGYYAFQDCTSLTSIIIPNSVTTIADSAFYGCSNLTSITIPDSVTSIGYFVFRYCSNLTSIDIPDSVTTIGSSAFSGCSSLTSITIPNGVTDIGLDAFYGCSSLISINIPESVVSIGRSPSSIPWTRTFDGCTSLTSINVDKNNKVYSSKDGVIFNKDMTEIMLCPRGLKGEYVIPDGVTSIGYCAFENCLGLTSVDIPDGVTSIEYHAFSNCSSLKSINIPDSVTRIGSDFEGSTFSDCTSLISINIPSKVTTIYSGTFSGCSSLATISIPDGVTVIDETAFWSCSNLTSITIPDSVTSIEDYTFSGCSSLTEITIPDSVTSIGYGAFEDCSDLTSITIPGSVTSIGDSVFYGCSSLTSIDVPNSVTRIGDYAFSRCSSLTSIDIPDSVTSIGYGAFEDCSSITSINLPDSVTNIEAYAFYICSNLTSVSISDNVSNIGNSAFYGTPFYKNQTTDVKYAGKWVIGCDSEIITTVEIKDGTVGIADFAFAGCPSLSSIIIPDSITNIGFDAFSGTRLLNKQNTNIKYVGKWVVDCDEDTTTADIKDGTVKLADFAFAGCESLNSIIIPNSVDSIGDSTFDGCESLTAITIPNSVTNIGTYAFNNCSSLTSVNMSNSMTSIEDYTFLNCNKLTTINIPDGVTSIGKGAFSWCHNLSTIDLPDSLTNIGQSAFAGCAIKSIDLPDGLTSIVDSAFTNCTSLTAITIPDSVTSIEWAAFYDCESLKDIYYTGSKEQWDKITIDRYNDNLLNTTIHYDYGKVSSPSAVSGLKLKARAADAIRLAWNKNTSADGYIIEMKDGSKWTRVAKITKNSTVEFRKAGLKAGTAYSFRVKAYKMSGKTALYGATKTISVRTNPSTTTGLKLKNSAKNAVRLSWTKNTSADGYIIEMKSGSSWTRVGKITSNSTVEFKKSKLKAGTAYTFRVKAYKMSGKTALYSGYTTISARTNPSVVSGLKLKAANSNAARLAWSKNTSADGYIIEMKSGSKWVRVSKITKNSTIEFKRAGLKSKTSYTFRVKAYKMSGKTALYSGYKTITVKTK